MAHALATCCYSWRKVNEWMTDPAQEITETKRLAERAMQLGQDDAQVLCWSGAALAFVVGQVDKGIALVDRASRAGRPLLAAPGRNGSIRAHSSSVKSVG